MIGNRLYISLCAPKSPPKEKNYPEKYPDLLRITKYKCPQTCLDPAGRNSVLLFDSQNLNHKGGANFEKFLYLKKKKKSLIRAQNITFLIHFISFCMFLWRVPIILDSTIGQNEVHTINKTFSVLSFADVSCLSQLVKNGQSVTTKMRSGQKFAPLIWIPNCYNTQTKMPCQIFFFKIFFCFCFTFYTLSCCRIQPCFI